MASESEQGHVDCTVKRRTRLVRITFVGSSVQSLTNSNRRIRNRTYGGVGGADERLSPLSRSRRVRSQRAARFQRGENRLGMCRDGSLRGSIPLTWPCQLYWSTACNSHASAAICIAMSLADSASFLVSMLRNEPVDLQARLSRDFALSQLHDGPGTA